VLKAQRTQPLQLFDWSYTVWVRPFNDLGASKLSEHRKYYTDPENTSL